MQREILKYIFSILLLIFGCKNENNRQLQKLIDINNDFYKVLVKDQYFQVECRYVENPYKFYMSFNKINDIRERLNELYELIELMKRSSKDFATNVDQLKTSINDLRDYTYKLLNDKVLLFKEEIDKYLIANIIQDQENLSQDTRIIILKIFKNNILQFEYLITKYLLEETEQTYFKFNRVEPVIIDKIKKSNQGYKYRGEICLAAFDTTRAYLVCIGEYDSIELKNGKWFYTMKLPCDTLTIENDKAIYNVRANRDFTYRGLIEILKPNGSIEHIPFKKKIEFE